MNDFYKIAAWVLIAIYYGCWMVILTTPYSQRDRRMVWTTVLTGAAALTLFLVGEYA